MENRNYNFKFDLAAYSSVGKRNNNEDAFLVSEISAGVLAIVGDGVGGYVGGEIASQKLIESANEHLPETEFSEDGLGDAVVGINLDVFSLGEGGEGPKTTLALLWVKDDQAYAVNVGDSRIYQFRNGEIIFQSIDHSLPQLAVQIGEIKQEDIRTHKDRNRITRCLGMDKFVSPNIRKLDVEVGDRFILCSDGFWEPVLESSMISAAEDGCEAKVWLERMREIATANEKDNHTAVTIVVLPQ